MPRIISTDVNIKQKNENTNNVNSRNININNVNCTDKSHQDKGFINCTSISRKGQEECYYHLERYFHMCRVAERCVDKFKMSANCRCTCYCSKSCKLKGWKQHKTVCNALS